MIFDFSTSSERVSKKSDHLKENPMKEVLLDQRWSMTGCSDILNRFEIATILPYSNFNFFTLTLTFLQ